DDLVVDTRVLVNDDVPESRPASELLRGVGIERARFSQYIERITAVGRHPEATPRDEMTRDVDHRFHRHLKVSLDSVAEILVALVRLAGGCFSPKPLELPENPLEFGKPSENVRCQTGPLRFAVPSPRRGPATAVRSPSIPIGSSIG